MAPTKSSQKQTNKLWREMVTDPRILVRRQKQIDYGKATSGYHNYLAAVPKNTRTPNQPRTPDKFQCCSRRSWDGQIKIWRLLLHAYDDDKSDKGSERDDSTSETTGESSEHSMTSTDEDAYGENHI